MKFINPGEAVQVRIQEGPNRFRWELVKTGETINLARDIGVNYGFEEVKVEATTGNIGDVKVETKQINTDKPTDDSEDVKKKLADYKRKLILIKGISSKTAKDIIKVFQTEEDLMSAISHDDELPFRDDIEEKLRKEYGK